MIELIIGNMWQTLIFLRSSNGKDAVIDIDDNEEPKVDISRLT